MGLKAVLARCGRGRAVAKDEGPFPLQLLSGKILPGEGVGLDGKAVAGEVDGGGELPVFRESEGGEIPARDGMLSPDAEPVVFTGGETVEDLETLQPLLAQEDEAVSGELVSDIFSRPLRLGAARASSLERVTGEKADMVQEFLAGDLGLRNLGATGGPPGQEKWQKQQQGGFQPLHNRIPHELIRKSATTKYAGRGKRASDFPCSTRMWSTLPRIKGGRSGR
ncbi:MAG: hypothetical protein BWY77_01214 [bacterium ADurb.Bin431]|nr:MAG: hypothetical protein BWY77_01214 [bacterium ADurb.Bin431]